MIPPPEQRLCIKHGKPIQPFRYRAGCRMRGCADCVKETLQKSRPHRKKKFDEGNIWCSKHPTRRATRFPYELKSLRRCNWCSRHRVDGSMKPSCKRLRIKSKNESKYRRSLSLRNQLQGRLRGIHLWERLTGIKLNFPNMRIL